jgi:phosphatidylglycerophosphate synthase
MNNNGKKINDDLENPIDLFFVNLTTKLNPYYKALYFTPNILTTLSIITTIYGLYLHNNTYHILGGLFYFIGYYFDCADGNFARTYKMTSEFGDYYDHITDFLKYGAFIYLLYCYNLPKNTIIFITSFVLLFIISSVLFLGCQEKIYTKNNNNKGSSFLKFTTKLCKNDEWIHICKYGSTGSLQLFSSLVLAFLPQINNILN